MSFRHRAAIPGADAGGVGRLDAGRGPIAPVPARRSAAGRRRPIHRRERRARRSRAATATTSPSTRSASPAIAATCGRSTSTRSTRCPIPAGSPTGSAGERCRSRRSSRGRTSSRRSTSTTGRSSRRRAAASRPVTASTDPTGHLYQVKFDPPEHPEMASAAEVIGAAIYHALGYNVVQGYAIDVDPDRHRHLRQGDDRGHVGPAPADAARRRRSAAGARRQGCRTASTARR